MTTRKEKADRLRARGIAVPNSWTEDRIDELLAEVDAYERTAPEPPEWEPASPRG